MDAVTRAHGVATSAGLLLVSGEGVRLAEWRPGRAEDVLRLDFPPLEQHELRGPAHAHPRTATQAAPGTHSGSQRDLFERREQLHRKEFVRDAAAEVSEIAERRGWLAQNSRTTSASWLNSATGAPSCASSSSRRTQNPRWTRQASGAATRWIC